VALGLDHDGVAALIKTVAREEVAPLFKNLQDHQIMEKTAGDPVTAADHAAEEALTRQLPLLLPGSVVIGEEAVHEDASILSRIDDAQPVWIIDPVDGTKNFSEGNPLYCVMVALAVNGRTVAGYIYAPETDDLAIAVAGEGALINGAPPEPSMHGELAAMTSAVHTRYLPAKVRRAMEPRIEQSKENRELYCAGWTYLMLARGELDFSLFWKTKPWDHAAGSLLLREAGGRVAFDDGQTYEPNIRDRFGLVATADAKAWQAIRDHLYTDVV